MNAWYDMSHFSKYITFLISIAITHSPNEQILVFSSLVKLKKEPIQDTVCTWDYTMKVRERKHFLSNKEALPWSELLISLVKFNVIQMLFQFYMRKISTNYLQS